jgi:hypothetical protein
VHHRVSNDYDVHDTIDDRHHAQAQSRTPELRGRGATAYHFGP